MKLKHIFISTTITIWVLNILCNPACANALHFEDCITPSEIEIIHIENEFQSPIYSKIQIPHFEEDPIPNHYNLPVKRYSISVPSQSCNYELDFLPTDSIILKLDFPITKFGNRRNTGIIPNEEYDFDTIYTNFNIRLNSTNYIGGFCKFINISICPIVYNIKDESITVYTKYDFQIRWISSSDYSIVPKSKLHQINFLETTKGVVINPQDVDNNAINNIRDNSEQKLAYAQNQNLPIFDYEYIIITTRGLKHEFERLSAMRWMKGIASKIICIEDILEDSRFANGDEISGINDDCGKLRAFLSYAYQNYGTQYVLLGGSEDLIPARKCIIKEKEYTSDLYYSELINNWDNNENGIIGEYLDLTNRLPQLYIGRLSCRNVNDVNAYIDKLYNYEFNPGNGDTSYLSKAFVYSCDDMYEDYCEINKTIYKNGFKELTESKQINDCQPTGEQIIAEINKDSYGFLDFQCHGAYDAVFTNYFHDYNWNLPKNERLPIYGISANDDNDSEAAVVESKNGLDNISNKYCPNWTISMSCSVLGRRNEANEVFDFGESFVLGKDYGGIAFVGYTGPGWMRTSNQHQVAFFNSLLEMNDSSIVGQINNLSKIDCKSRLRLTHWSYKDLLTMTMIQGDPFLNLWSGNTPIRHIGEYKDNEMVEIIDYDVKNNSIERYTTSCYNAKNEVLSQPNHEIVIQNSDLVPYIMPLEIDNMDINESKTIVANDVIIGRNGVVNISQSSILEIYASGDVTLNNINCASENSALLIHSTGDVYISNLIVSDKAKVEIEGSGISISPETSLFNTNIKIIQ